MLATVEEQKAKAIELMSKIIKYKPIINRFKRSDIIMFSEGPLGASYDADGEPELMGAIQKVREDGNFPFHATHNFIQGMECWTIMCVSQYKEEWQYADDGIENGIVFCYVHNASDPFCSEYGDCAFRGSAAGDVIRIS